MFDRLPLDVADENTMTDPSEENTGVVSNSGVFVSCSTHCVAISSKKRSPDADEKTILSPFAEMSYAEIALSDEVVGPLVNLVS
jgi:hypothetical protein